MSSKNWRRSAYNHRFAIGRYDTSENFEDGLTDEEVLQNNARLAYEYGMQEAIDFINAVLAEENLI